MLYIVRISNIAEENEKEPNLYDKLHLFDDEVRDLMYNNLALDYAWSADLLGFLDLKKGVFHYNHEYCNAYRMSTDPNYYHTEKAFNAFMEQIYNKKRSVHNQLITAHKRLQKYATKYIPGKHTKVNERVLYWVHEEAEKVQDLHDIDKWTREKVTARSGEFFPEGIRQSILCSSIYSGMPDPPCILDDCPEGWEPRYLVVFEVLEKDYEDD